MWEDIAKQKKYLHAKYYIKGEDTLLGEAANSRELFLYDECGDIPWDNVVGKVVVEYRPHHWNHWHIDIKKEEGGNRNILPLQQQVKLERVKEEERDNSNQYSYFYSKLYDPIYGRFVDPSTEHPLNSSNSNTTKNSNSTSNKNEGIACYSCVQRDILAKKMETKVLGGCEESDGGRKYYPSFQKGGVEYSIDDCVYLLPSAFRLHKVKDKSREKNNPFGKYL